MMKLLIILISVLFLIGCSNGGIELSSEREPQTSLDLDLLTPESLGSDEGLLASVDLDSVEEDVPVPQVDSDVKHESTQQEPREFGKRRKKDSDLKVQLEPEPETDEEPEAVQQSDFQQPREFGKRRKEDSSKDSDLVVKREVEVKPPVSVVTDINNKVDILFVVDGSFSTREILRSISERIEGFIPALDASLDWRIGFISADVKRGKDKKLSSMEIDGAIVLERKYITKGTRSKERIFIDTLTRNKNRKRCAFPPQCGSSKETPLLALTEYILSPSRSVETGTLFIRDEAHLAIVILTDNKENKKKGHVTTADEVLGSVEQEFGSDKEFSVHTLTVLNDACRDQLKQDHFFVEGSRAGEILLLAKETGGENLSLCSYDYATPLAESIEKSVLGSEVDCSACVNTSAISDQEQTV